MEFLPKNSVKQSKRTVNGVLLLDKPIGMSSNRALQIVKRLLNAKKAGHTGSLDPLASGMLPLCFGEATKFSQYLLEADKHYQVTMKLGVRTTTGDAEGELLSQHSVPQLTFTQLDKVFNSFRGVITQIPPMHSALKHQGQPLYRLARAGIEVERKSRQVTIHKLWITELDNDKVCFEMHCTKGTYVRTLVDDVGQVLGCGAFVSSLRRLSVSGYKAEEMVSLEKLTQECETETTRSDHRLLSLATIVKNWPQVSVTPTMAFYLKQGQAVRISKPLATELVQLVLNDGTFLGIGEMLENGMVAPRRIIREG